MELIYYASLAICMIISFANWRIGLYLCILMDVVRDPVRKLSESESILITVSASLLWIAVFGGVVSAEWREMRSIFTRYPSLNSAVIMMAVALVPGAVLSLVLYRSGYILAAIGCASYLGPLLGLVIGWTYPRYEKEIYKLISFYVVVNSMAMVGTYLEWKGYDIPGLGGLKNMEWIRYDEDRIIDLISGFYRSPDIMGLHAAHVIVFSAMLAMRLRGVPRISWGALASWGMFCVLISGRRKMIGIPIAFLSAYLLIAMVRGSRHATKATLGLFSLSLFAMVGFFFLREQSSTHDYEQYASSIFSHGIERSNSIYQSVFGTIYQSGVLGSGLGSATQGAYYSGIKVSNNWQEDGASRLLIELGVPGTILLLFAGWLMLKAMRQSLRMIPALDSSQQLQISLYAVVIGNAASFTISHQQYSGDPMSGLLVLFMLGAAMGAPRIRYLREFRKKATLPPIYETEVAESGL